MQQILKIGIFFIVEERDANLMQDNRLKVYKQVS